MKKTTKTDNHEPIDISKQVKNSLRHIQTKTPQTISCTAELKGHTHLVCATRQQMQILYEYMKDIGADASLLSASSDTEVERERNQAVFNKWFQTIVVQNNRFPQDIPITLVLRHFSRMVVQNKVQIKGYNLREQVRAFHTYLDNWEHELRGKWWQYQNPGDRPKPLPAFASVSTQEQAQSDEERGQMIHKMYGAEDVPESLQKFTNS